VIALSLAAQAWPPSNEAPRPVMRPSAQLARHGHILTHLNNKLHKGKHRYLSLHNE